MQPAHRVTRFKESTIREMTRVAMQNNAVNLSQGFPDYDTPPEIIQAAVDAIQGGLNQYTVTWGYPPLRKKLAQIYAARLGWDVDPDVHVTVVCGVTEAIVVSALAVLDPGDELIIIEPAHENFRPAAILAGATPVAVPLDAPGYRLDPARLAAAITPRTKAMILNTPHNPSGRVFDEEEMAGVIELVLKHDLVLITDEIYDKLLYDGRVHISPGSREALRDRTITCGGLGKTFAITGWRLGYVIAPTRFALAIRSLHDYMTICAATPLQAAAVAALDLPESYFAQQLVDYHRRRDVMMGILEEVGFVAPTPEGAYYTLADYSQLPIPQATLSPLDFALWMASEVKVAVVPGNNFYSVPGYGESVVRFAFPKKFSTLEEAGRRMRAAILGR